MPAAQYLENKSTLIAFFLYFSIIFLCSIVILLNSLLSKNPIMFWMELSVCKFFT